MNTNNLLLTIKMSKKKPAHDESMDLPDIDMKDVDLGSAFNNFIEVIKLNKKVIQGVASNKKGGGVAAIFLAAGALAAPLAQLIFGVSFLNVISRPGYVHAFVQSVLLFGVGALTLYIATIIATRFFKGNGNFADFFRVMGLVFGLNVLMFLGPILPALAPLIWLIVAVWILVVGFVVIKIVFKLDDANTVLTIVATVVVFALLLGVVDNLGYGNAQLMLNLTGI